MRRLVSIGLICAAVALGGCIGDEGIFGATTATAPAGAATSITGVSNASASAWTTPPPPGYQVQRPVVLQPTAPAAPTFAPPPPALEPAPIQPPPLPTQPPIEAPAAPSPELPSWTPPAPPPVEEAPDAGTGSGCGGGKG